MDWAPGYRELAPPASLRGALACLWISVIPADGGRPTLVLPDACTDLIWQSGLGAHVAGPDTGPWLSDLPGGTIVAGVRFLPGAGGPALRIALDELLDLRVDAVCLPAIPVRRLPGSLPPALALRRLAGIAEEMVADRPPDPAVRQAASLLSRPGAEAGPAAGQIGLSERQLRRRCQVAGGLRPATLRRVLRFRRFVSALDKHLSAHCVEPAGELGKRDGSADLAGMAAVAGYADQAHLTRECSRLAGLSPAALARVRAAGG